MILPENVTGLPKRSAAIAWSPVVGLVLQRLIRVAVEVLVNPVEIQQKKYNRPSFVLRLLLEDLFAADLASQALILCRHLLRRPRLSDEIIAVVGSTLLKQRQYRLAEMFFRIGLKRSCQSVDLLCGLGVLRYIQGRHDQALRCLQKVLSVRHDHVEALSNMGNVYLARGDVSLAIGCYQSAIQADPVQVDAMSNLGNALQLAGRLDDAVAIYQYALKICPVNVPVLSNLGIAYQAKGMSGLAVDACKAAIDIDPSFSDAWSNLGLSLQSLSRHDEALAAFEKALLLSPHDSRYRCNLANCCLELGRLEDALESYKAALDVDPSSYDFKLSCAIARLLYSNCCDGWDLYEARLTNAVIAALDPGHSVRRGRWPVAQIRPPASVFLSCEQGLGDTIHFCRYAKYLADQGVEVTLRVQSVLLPILRASSLGVRLLSVDEPLNDECDSWSPLLSLPLILGVSEKKPLMTAPYLSASDEVINAWAQEFDSVSQPVIAINWQGNPVAEVNNLKGRSIPLQAFGALVENVPARFVAVQYGEAREQLEVVSFRSRFVDFQHKLEPCCSLEDVAGIVANSLLLITSDTAVAHLAAAAGYETWLLLHYVPDWRWGLTGDSTFWYPTMRIFRQSRRGDWGSVMADVTQALKCRLDQGVVG